MTQSPAVLQNVYVMLAYAFRSVRGDGVRPLSSEPFTHLHDLLAEILVQGVSAQIKRGVHRDYNLNTDSLLTIRGRVDMGQTAITRTSGRSEVVCEFDEYQVDTPLNRTLKSVMMLLARRGEVDTARRNKLRQLIRHLQEVSDIHPSSIRWDTFSYNRLNADYRLLLGVGELIVHGLLPKDSPGDTNLEAWVPEEEMHALYERFLLEYFKFHHPQLVPSAPRVPWDLDEGQHVHSQLPAMSTDLVLRKGNKRLVVDAKYYSQPLAQGRHGKRTVRSDHLYQILAYAKNLDVDQDGTVAGLLLYAKTDDKEHPNLEVTIQGTRIAANTLDLSAPWEHLADQLNRIPQRLS